jgi:hypothetical protein
VAEVEEERHKKRNSRADVHTEKKKMRLDVRNDLI